MRIVIIGLSFAGLILGGACSTNKTETIGAEIPVEDISGTTATDRAETATTIPDSISVVVSDSLVKK